MQAPVHASFNIGIALDERHTMMRSDRQDELEDAEKVETDKSQGNTRYFRISVAFWNSLLLVNCLEIVSAVSLPVLVVVSPVVIRYVIRYACWDCFHRT